MKDWVLDEPQGSRSEVRLDRLEHRVAILEDEVIHPRLLVTIDGKGNQTIKRVPQDLEVATRDEVEQVVDDGSKYSD